MSEDDVDVYCWQWKAQRKNNMRKWPLTRMDVIENCEKSSNWDQKGRIWKDGCGIKISGRIRWKKKRFCCKREQLGKGWTLRWLQSLGRENICILFHVHLNYCSTFHLLLLSDRAVNKFLSPWCAACSHCCYNIGANNTGASRICFGCPNPRAETRTLLSFRVKPDVLQTCH